MTDRKSRLPWRPHYPADFLALTLTWPPIARLGFVALQDAQWMHGNLDADPDRLRAHVPGVTLPQWRKAWHYLEPQFPKVRAGRRNPQLEKLRAQQLAKHTERSAAGRRGARNRWSKGSPDSTGEQQ